ncbi:hypothetical protein DOT_3003 [Desulfosporosinus sp. OT]|nr:hypothetical protein DOT_3003 [Desulfosporosinus sp. OT]
MGITPETRSPTYPTTKATKTMPVVAFDGFSLGNLPRLK